MNNNNNNDNNTSTSNLSSNNDTNMEDNHKYEHKHKRKGVHSKQVWYHSLDYQSILFLIHSSWIWFVCVIQSGSCKRMREGMRSPRLDKNMIESIYSFLDDVADITACRRVNTGWHSGSTTRLAQSNLCIDFNKYKSNNISWSNLILMVANSYVYVGHIKFKCNVTTHHQITICTTFQW